jgi:hypothetical protein
MSPEASAVAPFFFMDVAVPPLTAIVEAPVLAFTALNVTELPAMIVGVGVRDTA